MQHGGSQQSQPIKTSKDDFIFFICVQKAIEPNSNNKQTGADNNVSSMIGSPNLH
jgi:hypothetical protein